MNMVVFAADSRWFNLLIDLRWKMTGKERHCVLSLRLQVTDRFRLCLNFSTEDGMGFPLSVSFFSIFFSFFFCVCVCVCVWLMAVFVRSRGDPVRFQLIPLTDWVVRGDMRDDSVEILLHSVLQEAPVSSSGMGLDVHSLMYIQHFLCWPRRRPPSKVSWRMVLGNTGGV